MLTSTWFTCAISAAACATLEYESTPIFLKLVNRLKPLVKSSWLNKVVFPNLSATCCNSLKANEPAPKFFKPCSRIAISLSLAKKVPILPFKTEKAVPTARIGAILFLNAVPKPFAAVDVAANDFVVPYDAADNLFVAAEALFKELTAFLVSTLRVTILSAT